MRKISILIVLVAMISLSGCEIYMSKTYSRLLDKTTAWSMEISNRASSGRLTEEEKIAALRSNAELWRKFKKANDGDK